MNSETLDRICSAFYEAHRDAYREVGVPLPASADLSWDELADYNRETMRIAFRGLVEARQIAPVYGGAGEPRHDHLTPLEALLLRVLYTVGCYWPTRAPAEVIGEFEADELDDDERRLLEQLLEEERADRQ